MSKPQPGLLPNTNLSDAARAGHSEVVATRHDLHRIPEIGLEEFKTAEYIEKRLGELGIPFQRITATGTSALIDSGQPGSTVMLRTDIDALHIIEEGDHDYVSTHPGLMHACGHDTHVAMLLGVARRLTAEGLSAGCVKLCFQPGEEGRHGAEQMIAGGILKNPDVDSAFAQHVWSKEPLGAIAIEAGPVLAAVDTVHVKLYGRGTHAAVPQEGADPIYAGAQVVTALQSVVSRNIDPLEPGVVTVAEFHGGTAHNIIPELVTMTLSVRVFDDKTHAIMEKRIQEIISGIAEAMGCRAEINYVHEHNPTVNNAEIAGIVREEAIAIVGVENVNTKMKTMGAEDFSDYLKQVPGAFVFIGAGNEEKGIVHPHHHPKFNIDEDALAIGAELMYRVAHRLLAR